MRPDQKGLESVAGRVYGLEIRGRLPADFASYLLPLEAPSAPSEAVLEIGYREIDALPEVEETWVSEVEGPAPSRAGRDPEPRGGRFALFPVTDGFGLAVDDEGRGLFHFAGHAAAIEWTPTGTGAAHYFFTYALPLWLESQGVPVLHGSAVAIDRRAVGFLGASGAGKSMLCAELVHRGAGFLADDGLALRRSGDGVWRCSPGPPLLRLWPSGLDRRLGIEAARLPRVHETIEKRELQLARGTSLPASQAESIPLAAIYRIERLPTSTGKGAVETAPVEAREALVLLLEHGVAGAPAAALGLSAGRLDRLAALVESVPVRRIVFPSGADSAAEVLAAIAAELP